MGDLLSDAEEARLIFSRGRCVMTKLKPCKHCKTNKYVIPYFSCL